MVISLKISLNVRIYYLIQILPQLRHIIQKVQVDGVTSQTAFYRTMDNTSKEAQNVVADANGNKVALDGLTKSSKAAELGMKALAMAGNMLLMWGVGEVISLVATAIDNYIHRVDNAKEALDSFNSSVKEQQNYLNLKVIGLMKMAINIQNLQKV